jgi:uncharacterized protein YciI
MIRSSPRRRGALAALALALLVPAPLDGADKKQAGEGAAASKPARPVKGQLFAVVLGPGPEWKKGQPLKAPAMPEHRRYWAKLNDEGRIASAGPLGEDTGLILMRARNLAAANAAIAGDPAVKARILRGVARPYVAAMSNPAVLEGG